MRHFGSIDDQLPTWPIHASLAHRDVKRIPYTLTHTHTERERDRERAREREREREKRERERERHTHTHIERESTRAGQTHRERREKEKNMGREREREREAHTGIYTRAREYHARQQLRLMPHRALLATFRQCQQGSEDEDFDL